MIAAHNITWLHNGRTVIGNINFTLPAGSIMALLGPNGAGKTTLLRCLAGYYQPAEGQVLLATRQINSQRERALLLGYMPQKTHTLTGVTVQQAVLVGRRPYIKFKVGVKDLEAVDKAINCLQLEQLAHMPLQKISAGEAQRVMLARLLAQNTKILLLDEPMNNLDPAWQLKVMDTLAGLAHNQGKTIIMSLHDLSLASRFCSHALLMLNGSEIAWGSPDEVLNKANLRRAFAIDMHIEQGPSGIKSFIPF